MSIEHPESLKKTAELSESDQDLVNFVTAIKAEVHHAGADRQAWEENLTRWYKKRYGIRPATKNFPFPNASNTHIFLTEEKIRRLKPNYINLALEGDPVVTMYPVGATPLEVAQANEIYMDWLLRFHMDRVPGMNYIQSLALTVDRFLEKGFSFTKQTYEHVTRTYTEVIDTNDLPVEIRKFLASKKTTDDDIAVLIANMTDQDLEDPVIERRVSAAIKQFRDGKTVIKMRVEATVYRGPRVHAVDAADLFVPPDTTDIESARFLAHRMYLTLNELRLGEKNGKYKNVDEVADNPGAQKAPKYGSTLDSAKANREGVTRYLANSSLIEVWEIFTWYDVDGDGVEEKVVVTYHPHSGTILRMIEYPYRHGQWPFVRWQFELTDPRWYSPRGLPSLLDHYQTNLTNQQNGKNDYLTIANSLQYKYRTGRVNPSNIKWIPGQGIPVERMEDLEVFDMPARDASFDQEMVKLRGLSEELIGQPDLPLTSLQQNQERRTAFEVSEAAAMGKQIFSLDARLFKASLQKMYSQLLALDNQYGEDEVWIRVTGQQPRRMTRAELIGDLVIVPNGEFTILSRTLEQQRSFALLELASKDSSGAINQYEAWKHHLLKVDPKAAQRILNSPQVYAQIQQMKMLQEQAEYQKKLTIAGRTPSGSNGSGAQGGGVMRSRPRTSAPQ